VLSDAPKPVRAPLRAAADAAVGPRIRPHVDVWCLPLVGPASRAAELGGFLTDDEKARLDRIVSATRRERARTAWGARRVILARILGREPRDIVIVRHGRGAPTVDASGHPLHVSLSHSEDWMLLAVSRMHRVGADIERIDPDADVVRLAQRFFTTDEAATLSALPEDEARRVFFRIWTRKEAVLKGLGGGVPSRLRAVPVGADEGRQVVRIGVSDWTLHGLAAPADYATALAVRGDATILTHEVLDEGQGSAIV
jgi:4'-phosphopantetheinyl transferase